MAGLGMPAECATCKRSIQLGDMCWTSARDGTFLCASCWPTRVKA